MTTPTEQNPAASQTAPRPIIAPRYRVSEDKTAFFVTAAVPGVAPSAVETIVDGEKLVVNARRTWSAPEGWTPVHREMTQADYRLVFELDRSIDRDKITAQLSQGMLTLTLPKAAELQPRKIEIVG